MGLYNDWLLPRCIDLVMRQKVFGFLRQRVVRRAHGAVLEIGFGSGLNLPYYSLKTLELTALDPSGEGRKLAEERIQKSPFPVTFVKGQAEDLPFKDEEFDSVVCTWTLCSVQDPHKVLKEVRRVLKPQGLFLFVEHGRSSQESVAKWQDRLTPLQKRLAGGCHLNRDVESLVVDAGFKLSDLDKFYWHGPKVASYMYLGAAAPRSQSHEKERA